MKHLHKSERGSVSIFLIIIVTVIFFFNAILIDYVRIITASYQTERAVKAAVRSVLSSYDTDLYDSYGLFGISGNETEIYNDTLEKNIGSPFGDFNFITIKLDDSESSIDTDYELAYHTVFKQQILEEMKYKAPIDFTIDILNQFSSLSLAMKEASNTTSILTDINTQYETRNNSLSNAISYRKKASELVSNNTSSQLEEIIMNYYNYQNSVTELINLPDEVDEEDKNQIKKEKEELERNITEYKQNAINLSVQLYNYYFLNLTDYITYLSNAEAILKIALNANEEMKNIINNANSSANNEHYDNVSKNTVNTMEDTSQAINNIKTINENISKNQGLPLSDEYFTSFSNEILEQKQLYQDLVVKLELLSKQVPNVFNNSSNISELEILKNEISGILSKYNTSFGDYTNPKNKISEKENELINISQELESEKEALEIQGETSLNKVLELINFVSTIKNQNDDFITLNQKFNKYKNFNNSIESENNNNSFNNIPDEAIGKATNEMDNIFLELASIIDDIRNDIYIEEYTFARFNHINPSNYNNLISGTTDNIQFDDDALIDLLDVSSQEIEYVIYGFNNVGGNFSCALRDIFMIRLAINLIEAFSNPRVLAATNPLIILLEATIYSISVSTTDLINILQGKEVPLAKKLNKVSYDYENYLRILYLVRGNEENKLSRIQALIDFESERDLTLIPTYIVGGVKVSIDLWFLPGVMKALSYVTILDGQVDKNRYFMNKIAAISY